MSSLMTTDARGAGAGGGGSGACALGGESGAATTLRKQPRQHYVCAARCAARAAHLRGGVAGGACGSGAHCATASLRGGDAEPLSAALPPSLMCRTDTALASTWRARDAQAAASARADGTATQAHERKRA
jgi:hypothetical protein